MYFFNQEVDVHVSFLLPEIPLELLKTLRPRQKRVIETDAIYVRACTFIGIPPSQTYVKQVKTQRSISMANTALSHTTVKPIAISLVVSQTYCHISCSKSNLLPYIL